MRNIFHALVISAVISTSGVSYSFAGPSSTSEVACSNYGSDALSCNQCFDGGTDYVGDAVAKNFSDTFVNTSSDDLIIARNGGLSAGPVTLQNAVSVGLSSDYGVSFPSSIMWFDEGGQDVALLFAGTETLIAEMNGGVLLTAVSAGADANRPAFRFEYITTVRSYDFVSRAIGVNSVHRECAFVTPRWCGDGIVSNGEVCDAGTANGQPGQCNNACTGTVPVVTTCNSITATPVSGTAPLDVAVACSATNASTYRIDCGNGTTNLSSNGVCRYVAGGTYAPTCTINGSITSPSCTTSVVVNPPLNPVCNPAKTGVQPAPVLPTDTLCSVGTVGAFTPVTVGNTIKYTWSCNNTTSVACAASFTPAIPAPYVSIKKYVKTLDATGDTQTAPVSIARGEVFNYYYQLQNTGSVAATGVVVKDTLPSYLTFSGAITVKNPAGVDVSSDWTCVQGSQIFAPETISRITLVCSKKTDLPANSGLYTFTIPVVLATTAPVAVNMQNVVYACVANQVGNPTGPNGEVICDNVNPPPPPPPGQCDKTNPNSQKDPACIVVTGIGFDLSLKKYIGTNDAQTAALGVSTTTNAPLNYIIRVTNSGPVSSSGTTTVQDILPVGVAIDGTASGSSWSCSISGVTIKCTSSLVVASGSSYPDITVPFRVTATTGQTVTNIAAVDNPLEVNRCMADGSALPATAGGTCTRDVNNSDPAVLYIPGGGGGGASHVGPKCINSVKSCALYNSLIACEAELGVGNCDSSDAPGQARCAAKTLVCSGPGGPTPGGGGNPYGRCGDGVLQPNLGEECDVVNAPWCVSCKISLTTTPGANPITDLWMTIPVLAGTQRLGYTWLDGTPGKVAFSDNRMVLGVGTKAFTLADSVGFGIRTQYRIPLMIEANKKICLKSEGASLNSAEICTTFATDAPDSMIWTRIDGKKYVVIGQGEFQSRKSDGTYEGLVANSPNNVTLFRGPVQYSSLQNSNLGPTLNSAFFGMVPGNNSTIGLFTDTGVDLVKLAVRVSGAVVSSIGSASNRAIESFINTRDVFADFLGTTIGYTSTTSSNNTTTTTAVTLPTIVGAAGGTVSSVAELERYAVNGNKNILAVTGDLTITCPVGSTVFTMTGVRSVIVSGNLILKCNIVYGSSDTTSSWAWIAKGGNIQVYNGTGTPNVGAVTNLAGVYVAVKEAVGGNITYTGANTTQAILRIEGTLYGNASPLFASRLYARATGAYDILTTGTILTYSNRALVSPPPLLSQYLGTYQVQRVVQ